MSGDVRDVLAGRVAEAMGRGWSARDVSDCLAPVVERLCREAAADALRQAADWCRERSGVWPADELDARADAAAVGGPP